MKTTAIRACLLLTTSVALARGAEVDREGTAAARAEAIHTTLSNIQEELKTHGGTWERWAESLKPYREDIRDFDVRPDVYPWPWPARKGYIFQGAAIRLHLTNGFDGLPPDGRPLDSIVHFDRQLKTLGIDLIVAIIPAKLTVYPDYIRAAVEGEATRPARAPADRNVCLATKRLMMELLEKDVEVVDLHRTFADYRRQNGDEAPLFYVQDSHYRNLGARVAASNIAERLKRHDFVQKALAAGSAYVGEKGARHDGTKADNDLLFVKNAANGARYSDAPDSPVVVCGDSHLAYNEQFGAHVTAQIALLIGMPVSRITHEGLSGTIPISMASDRNLRNRRVVVMHFTERMLPTAPGSRWPIVSLPGAAIPPQETDTNVTVSVKGVVREISDLPDPKAPYRHFLMKLYVAELKSEKNEPMTPPDGVVVILAMHDRKVLPIAGTKKGQSIALRLTPWTSVEKTYGRIQAGTLPSIALELDKRLYWGEVEGQPALSGDALAGIGEEDASAERDAPPAPASP